MPTATAKAFRQQILKPAEGIFLFHARAIERLIEAQFGARLHGVSIPDLPYYLMPKQAFLFGLESENAEALSVIEGLRLPDYVILLPSPADQRLEEPGFRRLRYDYWARGFEAEVARAWQMARDDNLDDDLFGPRALQALIGGHAFAEVREVLDRDGVILPIWTDVMICRAFVANLVRLRYFAAGARGFFFPAIQAWPEVDRWLSASGLDLPEPLQANRLPMLLVRSRPGGGDLPAEVPLLPTALPFGSSDPDLPHAIASGQMPMPSCLSPANSAPPVADRVGADLASESRTEASGGRGAENRSTGSAAAPETGNPAGASERRSLEALRRGFRIRRRPGRIGRIRDGLGHAVRRMLCRLLLLPGLDDIGFHVAGGLADSPADNAGPQGWPERWQGQLRERWHALGLVLLEQSAACAQHAEFEGRFAMALRYLVDARRLAQRINGPARVIPGTVDRAIGQREADAERHLSDLLAAKWRLDRASAAEIGVLVGRLASEDRGRYGSVPARALLGALEQVLSEWRNDYYVLRPGSWLLTLGRTRVRQVLPFQVLLKALRALETGAQRLEEMPWAITDLERFGQALSTLTQRVNARLDAQISPRLGRAMDEADFVPRDHRETVAAHKMKLELLDVIKQRRQLKFTDVRDVVARNILRLPDPTLSEFFRGDRLGRFDRTAARALPGVYRPGEFYIKGLQQLGAPLFGTNFGRGILRHLLLPFGSAYLVLKSLDVIYELIPHYDPSFHLTSLVSVLVIGTAVNIALFTGVGRHVAVSLWRGALVALRFLLYEGMRRLWRWAPVSQLLNSGLARGLGRNLVQPLLIGTLPLVPIIALAVFVEEVPIEPGLWLAGLAFALGTLLRNTPAGRRFLDNLSTDLGVYLRRINQALFIGAIQQLLFFFKEVTRRFSQLLNRVDEALSHHLGEHPSSLVVKALLAPLWRLAESVIQFYVTVLVEPQVNPVKHFPIVTIGHKLLLPFLPAITAAFIDVSASVLPKVIAYPLVTLTIILLPGLFGFLVWELKENWKLYQANHSVGLRLADEPERAPEALASIEPAVVGAHGETMRELMSRGFHSGTLPKGFDRLRRVIRDEIRDQANHPKRLRRVQRQLQDVQRAVCVFFEREFAFALRERCRDPACSLRRIETGPPRIATNLIELRAELFAEPGMALANPPPLRPGGAEPCPASSGSDERVTAVVSGPPAAGAGQGDSESLHLRVQIYLDAGGIRVHAALDGCTEIIGPACWRLIREDLNLFAGRAGAKVRELDLLLPPRRGEVLPAVVSAQT